jgi:hypothetical protein
MPQAVSRRLFTAETRVRYRAGSCEVCSGQNGTGAGFSPEYVGFRSPVLFYRCFILLFISTLLLPDK